MGPDSPRITELRRRVENDPSSIAFAQLAEEYRRAGNYEAAERYCRTGLQRHPAYLSARVTLGRTLLELNKLEEAEHELQHVLAAAPDNLAALRGVAEIHQRLASLETALEYYRRALALSRHDPELEEIVERLQKAIAPPPPTAAPASESMMDFDALLDTLGIKDKAAPPVVEALLADSPATPAAALVEPAASGDSAPGVDSAGAEHEFLQSALDHFAADERALDDSLLPPAAHDEPEWMRGPLPDIRPPADDETVADSATASLLAVADAVTADAAESEISSNAAAPGLPDGAPVDAIEVQALDETPLEEMPEVMIAAARVEPVEEAIAHDSGAAASVDLEAAGGREEAVTTPETGSADPARSRAFTHEHAILEELEAWLDAIKR